MEDKEFDYSIDELFQKLKEDPSWNEDAEERAAIADELKMSFALLGY